MGSFRQQDLREKLSRRRKPLSRSRSRSPKVRHKSKSSLRARSRTPSERSRSYSKHAYKSNRTLSPGELSDSPPFKTPYRPRSRSRDNGYRFSSSPRRERNSQGSHREENYERASCSKSKSKSTHPGSSREFENRRVMELSPKTTVNTSRVVAGVNVDDDVRKMLKKIVSKESEQKKWKNEKLQLVLKKSKKKKRKKSKSDAPVIKNEVDADSLPPSNKQSKIVVKREPGLDASPPPPPNLRSIDVSQPSYFKPNVELELQPILGHSKCRICKSYYPD